MTAEQKKRLKSSLIYVATVIAVGVAYGVFYTLTGVGIPCLLTLFTGGYCPGCGITRMFLSLARLDFVAAFKSNVLIMTVLPFALPFFARRYFTYIKYGEQKPWKIEKIFVIIVSVLTVAFWIMRNIDVFAFLRPC